MKPAEPWPDAVLDAALREVAVPAGLADRLRPETLFDDHAVDRILGDVVMPAGLAARLRATGSSVRAQSVEHPVAVPGRGRWVWRRLRPVIREGLAVAGTIGVAAALFVVGMRIADWGRGPSASPRGAPASTGGDAAVVGRAVQPAAPREGRESQVIGDAPLPAFEAQPATADAIAANETLPRPAQPPSVRAAPMPGFEPGAAVGRPAAGLFPGMRVVPGDQAAGTPGLQRAVPRMRGFDLAFEMAHGESPFVDPSINPGLAVDRPPLDVSTESFDRVWPLPAGRRRSAEIEGVRVEHLLAAVSAPAPHAASDGVTLALSALRSLRPGRPTYLVEVRVDVPVANGAAEVLEQPSDITVVLDHSAAPGAVPLWLSACRGLATAVGRMPFFSRVTVIVAEPRPRVVAIRAAADEIRRLAAELEAEPPFGSADLDAAVVLARETAEREGASGRLVVIAHAAHAERCTGAGRLALDRWREAARRGDASGTTPRFLLVSGVADGSSADVAEMPGWTQSDPTTTRRRFTDLLCDRSGIALEDAHLAVRFDPTMIAAYRLVGHRQSVPESLSAFGRRMPAEAGTTLHEGERVRAVYEVVPRQPPGDQLRGISAALTARDAGGVERTWAARGAVLDPEAGGVPSPAACELLLAVAVGEFPGRSVHAVPRQAAVEGVRGLTKAWERRTDVTALGQRLIGLFAELSSGAGARAGR